MPADREETLRQFCDVTGADEARSRFFLESSNWQLEIALSSFYEHGGSTEDQPLPDQAAVQVLSDSEMDSDEPGSPMDQQKKDKKPKPASNQRFATLSTLQQQESSSDEEEGQAFFAGGSERSGQQILGPGKNKKDIVTEMFKTIRERGAVMFDDEPSSNNRGGGSFGGVGYRLGQTADDHEAVDPASGGSQVLSTISNLLKKPARAHVLNKHNTKMICNITLLCCDCDVTTPTYSLMEVGLFSLPGTAKNT